MKSSVGLDVEVLSLLQKYRGEEAEGKKQLLREELERDDEEEEKEYYEGDLLEPLQAGH